DGPDATIKTLSGGNIQKVVAAREFSSEPELLILSQPTRGIDVGAAELIRQKMLALRDRLGTAILLFSADLTELLTMSDGIIVFFDGEIVAYFPDVKEIDEEILGKYMLGLEKQSPEEIGGVIHEN
ncbi:MAG: ABC transporter ATP-binding protein, partial [Halanaerobiaceae bacterium]|nr:ABC transporter ATP-binding protein [Halanaerobiaceae bacterium]